jgi:protein gp37
MAETSIEWTDATWNPVAGCSVISPGCTNCYAMRMAARLEAMAVTKYSGLKDVAEGDRFGPAGLGWMKTLFISRNRGQNRDGSL